MPEFTKEDRNLLVRIGRVLREDIEREERIAADPIAVDPRGLGLARRNRLLRDERDLVALRKRLEAQQVPPAAAQE